MSESRKTEVTYRSGIHPTQGWDVIHVIYQSEDADGARRVDGSFVIARDANGIIRRKTDLVLDMWEVIASEDDLKFLRSVFENRDRLMAEKERAALENDPKERRS